MAIQKAPLIALVAIVSFLIVGFSTSSVEAAGFPSYLINDDSQSEGGNDRVGELIYSSDGRLHAVWSDARNGSNNLDIYYAYSTDSGYTWSDNIQISNAVGSQLSPRLAACGSKIAVVWQNPGVHMAVSYNNGQTWSATKTVNDAGESPDIAMNVGCKMSVVYREIAGGQANIMYRRSINDGDTWTSAVAVDHTSAATNLPRILIDPNNHVHVGWFDSRNYPYNDVYYNYSTSWGSTWQPQDFLISTSSNPEEGASGTVDFEYGLVNGQASLIAVWTSGVENESYPYIARWTGFAWTPPVRVSNSYGNFKAAGNANVEIDNGTIVVIWDHDRFGRREIRYAYSHNLTNFWNEGAAAIYRTDPTFFAGGIHQFKDGVLTVMFHDSPNVYSSVWQQPDYNLAFVTSQTYNGNLGGLVGADSQCQARATAAGLPGTYRAWLSTSSVDAIDRIDEATYYKIDGSLLAYNKYDLTDGTISSPISRTELNQIVVTGNGLDRAYTGTNADGTVNTSNCNNWTAGSISYAGRWGDVLMINSFWSSRGASSCNVARRLYCFQSGTANNAEEVASATSEGVQ